MDAIINNNFSCRNYKNKLYLSLLILCFFIPLADAIHYGQITILLTALLMFGIKSKGFTKGLLTSLVSIIKPTYAPMCLFVVLKEGKTAFYGACLPALLLLINIEYTLEFFENILSITNREFPFPYTTTFLIGKEFSLLFGCLLSLLALYNIKNKDDYYVMIITVFTVTTALWLHSYVTLIIPIIYLIYRRNIE